MRAAVLREFGRPLELADVPVPEPADGEVLIRVRSTGLCGTDLKVVAGALSSVDLPLIPRHEVAGEVVGDHDGLRDGERVACYMYEPCGRCRTCRLGHGSVCPQLVRIGIERNGGLGEYMSLRAENALPIEGSVTFAAAAVAMDAILTPWNGLLVRGGLRADDYLLVVGAGGLGLNAVQIGRGVGARVAVIDIQPSHQERALEVGAELAAGPDEIDLVRDWSDGGADLAFDASGAPSGFAVALNGVRRGGRVVIVGYDVGREYAFESSRTVLEELSIVGARVGTRDQAREVLCAVRDRTVRPSIMDRLPLDEVEGALARLREGGVAGRLVIDMRNDHD